MGTNIQKVDYEAMPGVVREMQAGGKALNDDFKKVYEEVNNMHESWYGKRYNSLVDGFNNMIPSINEMMKLVRVEIPNSLGTIAKNYAKVDGQNVSYTADSNAPINQIAKKNDVGMRFVLNNVVAARTKVEKNFNAAKTDMNKIETTFKKMDSIWQSEAANAFKRKFTELKKNIEENITSILNDFSSLMEQAQQDMTATENTNTVN